jgi:hypothetical protein
MQQRVHVTVGDEVQRVGGVCSARCKKAGQQQQQPADVLVVMEICSSVSTS